ncbi:hypothetical protein K7B10_36405 [Streptomyces flavotricini]|uniref:Cupin n=1 Tax=Streptomyces flavotricini TaxID=66888 RepID=A0ABS8EGG4_9ACTN|nr:hypothetical protein [Streptomyces flavotricini]MCC0100173.1 hypothetical protein [Streptomyces flavotricini]
MSDPHTPHEWDGDQLRELALFVRTHSGKGPGILWPEHADPDDWRRSPETLAAGITLLLGRPVTVRSGPSPTAPNTADLLVLQQTGSSRWRLGAAGIRTTAQDLRLRSGEALFIPGGYTARVEQTASSGLLCLTIGTATPASTA